MGCRLCQKLIGFGAWYNNINLVNERHEVYKGMIRKGIYEPHVRAGIWHVHMGIFSRVSKGKIIHFT